MNSGEKIDTGRPVKTLISSYFSSFCIQDSQPAGPDTCPYLLLLVNEQTSYRIRLKQTTNFRHFISLESQIFCFNITDTSSQSAYPDIPLFVVDQGVNFVERKCFRSIWRVYIVPLYITLLRRHSSDTDSFSCTEPKCFCFFVFGNCVNIIVGNLICRVFGGKSNPTQFLHVVGVL